MPVDIEATIKELNKRLCRNGYDESWGAIEGLEDCLQKYTTSTLKDDEYLFALEDIAQAYQYIKDIQAGKVRNQTFGEYVKEARLEKGISFRDICKKLQVQPEYWSKIERGLLSARKPIEAWNLPSVPRIEYAIYTLYNFLSLEEEEATQYYQRLSLPIITSKLTEEEFVQMLPAFPYTEDGVPFTQEQIETLYENLKEQRSNSK